MEMTKKIYLETLKSVLGHSVLHYWCLPQIFIPGNLFLKKIHDPIAKAAKALLPYIQVLHVSHMKRPCDANLVFCSCVSDARMKASEKTEGDLRVKCLEITSNKIMRLNQKT